MRGFVSLARQGVGSSSEDEKRGKKESCYLDGRQINGWQHPMQHNKLTAALAAQRVPGHFVRTLIRDLFDLFDVACAMYNCKNIFHLDHDSNVTEQ